MTPQVSDFIPGLLEYTDKYSEVEDGNYVTANKIGQSQVKMCNDNGNHFGATLRNILLAPDICDRLFFDYYVNEFRK